MSNSVVKVGDIFENEERVIKVTSAYDFSFYAKDIAVKKPRLKIREREVYYKTSYLSHYGMRKVNEKSTNKEAM